MTQPANPKNRRMFKDIYECSKAYLGQVAQLKRNRKRFLKNFYLNEVCNRCRCCFSTTIMLAITLH